MPAYFIRLAKCNLACSFCDTYFDSGEVQTFDQIFNDIDNVISEFYSKRNMDVPEWAKVKETDGIIKPRKMVLVITGGEPTLQSNLVQFLERAQHQFEFTQIESNGTIGTTMVNLPKSTTVVVSPKCLEKKRKVVRDDGFEYEEDYAVRYLEPKASMLERADCLKFVMSVPENERFNPYSEVPVWAHEWAVKTGKPVFVSPMNVYRQEPKKAKEMRASKQLTEITIEERSNVDETISFWEEGLLDMKANQRNHEYTADYAMKHGFILNLQIHLYASLP
jgi:organic radical activating enzyme